MKKRTLVVAGILATVALVVFGAAELLQTRAQMGVIELPECENACLVQYLDDLNDCNERSGREKTMCRKAARSIVGECLQACSL